jgi:hypothetical protein
MICYNTQNKSKERIINTILHLSSLNNFTCVCVSGNAGAFNFIEILKQNGMKDTIIPRPRTSEIIASNQMLVDKIVENRLYIYKQRTVKSSLVNAEKQLVKSVQGGWYLFAGENNKNSNADIVPAQCLANGIFFTHVMDKQTKDGLKVYVL